MKRIDMNLRKHLLFLIYLLTASIASNLGIPFAIGKVRCFSLLVRNNHESQLDYEDGFRAAIHQIDWIASHKPSSQAIVVNVYGEPHSGKSHLISALEKHYNDQRSPLFALDGGDNWMYDSSLRELLRLERESRKRVLYFVHDIQPPHVDHARGIIEYHEEDAVFYLGKIGRYVDLRIGIYNPSRTDKPERNSVHLIIRNPDSTIKWQSSIW